MSIRFSTLLRDYAPVQLATKVTAAEWVAAVEEGRFATIYHGESDFCTPLVGIARHGVVNSLCKIVFAKPLPAGVDTIVGMRNNQQAWALCNA